MAASDRIHGSHGSVKIDKTGGALAVDVASLNKWSLSMATDKVDVTCFGDTNKIYVQGLPDVKGSIAGFWDKTDRTMFEIAMGTVSALLKLAPSTLDPTYLFSGLAWLDASIDVSADGAVSISGDFVAAGPWAMEPAIVP
jgi:hypothetical protein